MDVRPTLYGINPGYLQDICRPMGVWGMAVFALVPKHQSGGYTALREAFEIFKQSHAAYHKLQGGHRSPQLFISFPPDLKLKCCTPSSAKWFLFINYVGVICWQRLLPCKATGFAKSHKQRNPHGYKFCLRPPKRGSDQTSWHEKLLTAISGYCFRIC